MHDARELSRMTRCRLATRSSIHINKENDHAKFGQIIDKDERLFMVIRRRSEKDKGNPHEEKEGASSTTTIPQPQGAIEQEASHERHAEGNSTGSTQATTTPPRAQQNTTTQGTNTQKGPRNVTSNMRKWKSPEQVEGIEMTEERVVEILRTFTRSLTKVSIIDITWSTRSEDRSDHPNAIFKMHVLANVEGMSTDHPQCAVHTPHTHTSHGGMVPDLQGPNQEQRGPA